MTSQRLLRAAGLTVAGLGVLALPADAAPIQWTTASGGNGHWYELITTQGSFNQNRAAAAASTFTPPGGGPALQGHLVSIGSAEENAFVTTLNGGTESYIGFTDNEAQAPGAFETGLPPGSQTSAGWKWADRPQDPTTYRNWGQDEPNDWQNSVPGEDYVVILGSGTWNDLGAPDGNSDPRAYVVEYSDPVPEPVGLSLLGLGAVGLLARRRRR